MKGTIIKGIGGFYYVDTNESVIECRARGKFRKTELTPMVGDTVEIELSASGQGSVTKIEMRRNELIRPAVSNIDLLVIVTAVSNPSPDRALIDKMLVIAESKGIEGILCVNKTDLDHEDAKALCDCYIKAGYKAFLTSAAENDGVEELKRALSGKTAAFAGLSGVGKSSLLSIITGQSLETGSTSKIERGRHTTRHIELIKAGGAYVFDTPGFSQLEVEDVKAAELKEFFPEVWKREGLCRFRGCSHTAEPDCAVKEAVEKGEIAASRYESYVSMYEKLKMIKEWETK